MSLSAAMLAFIERTRTFSVDSERLDAQRAAYDAMCRAFTPPMPDAVSVSDVQLGGVPVRCYLPVGAAPSDGWPGLIFLHGGGWIFGGLDSHAVVCGELARRLKLAIVAVDYRLAPEHPYPAALKDCMAVWLELRFGRSALPLDVARLVVAGDSAGGNLAVALCLALRDAGQRQPLAQAVIYPALSHQPLPSHQALADAPLLSRDDMQQCLDLYLPDPALRASPFAMPLAAEDFRGLPPAFIAVAEVDPLCDDGRVYAQRLQNDHVPVHFHAGGGLVHGALRAVGVAEVDALYDDLATWLDGQVTHAIRGSICG